MENSQFTTSQNSDAPVRNPLYSLLLKIVNESSSPSQVEKGMIQAAKALLLQNTLIAGNKRYQLMEIEFYFYHATLYPDPYSHSSQYPNSVRAKQSVTGSWYFHRFTGMANYTHTRRGLDLTYGDGKKERYGGILIRALKDMKNNRIISGPSRVVGEIIAAVANSDKLETIAFDKNAGVAFDEKSTLFLEHLEKPRPLTLYSTTRFGIGNKNLEFRAKNFRFFTDLLSVKKSKGFEYQKVEINEDSELS